MLLVCLILGAVGGSSVVLYKALELAITGVQESIEKSSTADANAFANKFVALLHSFATVTFALMVLATFPYGSRELLALRHTGVAILIIWEVSYLIHDTWSMLLQKWRHKRPLDHLVMVHHVSLAVLLPIYFLYQKGDFYLAAMYLQNASTPLLHGRYMLLKSELKGSVVHKVCAVSLLVVFFTVRILVWPLLFAVHAYSASIPMFEIHRHVRSYCLVTAAAMSAMNMLWWVTLVRKILKKDMRMQYEPVRKFVLVEGTAEDVVGNNDNNNEKED